MSRAQQHIERLQKAEFEPNAFLDALAAIREDKALSEQSRRAIEKLVAQESFIWYLEAIRTEPIDRAKLLAEAERLKKEGYVGVDLAEKLLLADISKTSL